MDWNETPAELARARAEQPVIMPGQHGKLYGIFTPPAPEAAPARLCVIFFGRNRWWGDRLSVKGARWLAARGLPCLRFDYHGYGESEGDSHIIEGDRPYPEDALAAIRYAREQFDQERFALAGFCFDGRSALSAVEQEGDSIETVVCIAAEVTQSSGELLTHITLDKIRDFLRMPTRQKKRIILQALRRGIYLSKAKIGRNGSSDSLARFGISEKFSREFRALVRSRVQCLFLYGRDDAEYHGFQFAERYLLARLNPEQKNRFTVEVWPGEIHIPDDPELQRRVVERALVWLDQFWQKRFGFDQPARIDSEPAMPNGLRA